MLYTRDALSKNRNNTDDVVYVKIETGDFFDCWLGSTLHVPVRTYVRTWPRRAFHVHAPKMADISEQLNTLAELSVSAGGPLTSMIETTTVGAVGVNSVLYWLLCRIISRETFLS